MIDIVSINCSYMNESLHQVLVMQSFRVSLLVYLDNQFTNEIISPMKSNEL